MKNLNKYESLEVEVVVIENDIITTSTEIGPGVSGGEGENPFDDATRSNVLHIFKH